MFDEKQYLNSLTASDWNVIISKKVRYDPLPYKLSSSSDDADRYLIELYDKLNQETADFFRESLTNVFVSMPKKQDNAEALRYLVSIVGYVNPTTYFDSFFVFLQSGELRHIQYRRSNIHAFLMGALIKADVKKKIGVEIENKYLKYNDVPSYYSTAIRYYHTQETQNDVGVFLDKILIAEKLINPAIFQSIALELNSHFSSKYGYEYLFNWFKERIENDKYETPNFLMLKKAMIDWLEPRLFFVEKDAYCSGLYLWLKDTKEADITTELTDFTRKTFDKGFWCFPPKNIHNASVIIINEKEYPITGMRCYYLNSWLSPKGELPIEAIIVDFESFQNQNSYLLDAA
jgi:hypothetical protein